MDLRGSLTDVIRKLDNGYLAFGVYTTGRLGDCITTALGFEKYGYNPSSEINPIARFFMEHFGMYEAGIIHELVWLTLLLGTYKFLLNKGYKKSNLIPYALGVVSILPIINNLQYCLP